MSKLSILLILVLGFLVISCATTSTGERETVKLPTVDEDGNPIDWAKEIEAYNADPNNEIKIICEKYTPTGSHIPRTMCQTTVQKENRRREDQRAIEEFIRRSG